MQGQAKMGAVYIGIHFSHYSAFPAEADPEKSQRFSSLTGAPRLHICQVSVGMASVTILFVAFRRKLGDVYVNDAFGTAHRAVISGLGSRASMQSGTVSV